MRKFLAVIAVLVGLALVSTTFAGANYFAPSAVSRMANSIPTNIPGGSIFSATIQILDQHSTSLAPASWLLLGAFVVWRGRLRAEWMQVGFDSDVFRLFVTSRGAGTRLRMLSALSSPKYRLQLARELSLTWRVVDRHIAIMRRYGLVDTQAEYGKITVYSATDRGKLLTHLVSPLLTL